MKALKAIFLTVGIFLITMLLAEADVSEGMAHKFIEHHGKTIANECHVYAKEQTGKVFMVKADKVQRKATHCGNQYKDIKVATKKVNKAH